MNFILFGGEGFIGQRLKRRLETSGHTARTVDLAESADWRGSVADFAIVSEAMKSSKPDIAVNLAGLVGVPACAQNPETAFQTNALGAWNIALACSLSGVRLIHVSSTTVYGATATRKKVVTEDDECVPQSVYGFTKLTGEYAVKSACLGKGLSSIILRPSNVYGSNQRERNAIQLFIDKASKKAPITIHGDGKQTKCFTFVDDVVDAITRVGLAEWNVQNGDYRLYNISTGRSLSILDLVKIMEHHFGKLELTFEQPRKGDFSEATYSIDRIRKDYQFEPMYSLEKGIERVLKETV